MKTCKKITAIAAAGVLLCGLATPAVAAEPISPAESAAGIEFNKKALNDLNDQSSTPAGGTLIAPKTSKDSDVLSPMANLPAKNGYYTMSGWNRNGYLNGGFSSSWTVSSGGTKYAMSSGRSEANWVPTSYSPSSRYLKTTFGFHGLGFTVSFPWGVSGNSTYKEINIEKTLGSGGRYIAQDYSGISASGPIYSIDQHITIKMESGSTDRYMEVH